MVNERAVGLIKFFTVVVVVPELYVLVRTHQIVHLNW